MQDALLGGPEWTRTAHTHWVKGLWTLEPEVGPLVNRPTSDTEGKMPGNAAHHPEPSATA